MEAPAESRYKTYDNRVRSISDQSANAFARLGLNRLASGVVLITLGILMLVFPQLIVWIVGLGAIVLGVLVLAYAPPTGQREGSEPRPPEPAYGGRRAESAGSTPEPRPLPAMEASTATPRMGASYDPYASNLNTMGRSEHTAPPTSPESADSSPPPTRTPPDGPL